MARRVWIIARKDQVEQSDRDDAKTHNCPEIANGIPPTLKYIVHDFDLPCAYEEPELPPPEPPRDLEAEIDEMKVKIAGIDEIKTWAKTKGFVEKKI